MEYQEWNRLSYRKKNYELYLSQVNTLKKFLARNAISKAEYDKSLHTLKTRMQEI